MLKEHIKTAITRYGDMAYYVDDFIIGASLAIYGEYSQLEIEFLARIVKPGWTVLDIGANIGCLTVPLAQMVGPTGKVYAYEPQPESFQLLQANTYRFDNIEIFQRVVGERNGSLIVPPLSTAPARNYGHIELLEQYDFGDRIDMLPLDSLAFGHVSLIKIDVEGMEVEVLKGAANLIERCRPVLYLENDRVERSEELFKLLKNIDYVVYDHRPNIYNMQNFNKAPQQEPFGFVNLNVLALPREQALHYARLTDGLKMISVIPLAKPTTNTKAGWACIARLGGVGDNLIAASVCKPLKELGYRVEVISQSPTACLFENNPYIDKLSVYDQDDLPKDSMLNWQKWFALRAKEYDRFCNLSNTGEVLHAAFPGMTQFWWPAKVRRKIFGGSYLESAHDLLDVPYSFGRLFWPTEEEIRWAQELMNKIGQRPVIGWCISGTRMDKVYPQSPQVIGRLIKETNAAVVISGRGPGFPEFELAKQAMDMVKAQNGDTKGLWHIGSAELKLRNALTFLQQCDLVIGPDTGPMWAVAMESLPKIMLLSHAAEDAITKHWVNTVTLHADQGRVDCWPCHQLHDTSDTCRLNEFKNGAACISDISGDVVVSTARKLLSGEGHA